MQGREAVQEGRCHCIYLKIGREKRGRKQQLFVMTGRIIGERLAGEIEP